MKGPIKWSEFLVERYSRVHRVPPFLLCNRNFNVVNSATEFYALLVRGIRESRFRINLSTLYFGFGSLEKFLFKEILDASNRNQNLKVSLTVDKNRGQRSSSANGESSEDLFRELIGKASNPHNLSLTLFQHSDVSRKSLWGSSGGREIFGTFHLKHYMFDDSVILSGANLSTDYFTTRYDRYLYVQEGRELCDFLEDFDRIGIDTGDRVTRNESTQEGWAKVAQLRESMHRQFSVYLYNAYSEQRLAQTLARKAQEDAEFAGFLESASQGSDPKRPREMPSNNPDPDHAFSDACAQAFGKVKDAAELPRKVEAMLEFYREKYAKLASRANQGSSLVFPTFQLSLINYRVEEELVEAVLRHLFGLDAEQQYELTFTTGYFNPSERLIRVFRLLPPNVSLKILVAAPMCNSYFGARGIKGYVPGLYRLALRNWMQEFEGRPNVEFREFSKTDATYHAKGLWMRCLSDPQAEYLTVYGSSNFSERSYNRDLENQFYLVTRDPEQIRDFEEERLTLWGLSRPISQAEVSNDPDTPIGLVERGLFRLFKNSL